jgi:hypothetical protein
LTFFKPLLILIISVSPEKIQEIQAKIDKERRVLEQKKGLEEAERNKIAANLEKRQRELQNAK